MRVWRVLRAWDALPVGAPHRQAPGLPVYDAVSAGAFFRKKRLCACNVCRGRLIAYGGPYVGWHVVWALVAPRCSSETRHRIPWLSNKLNSLP